MNHQNFDPRKTPAPTLKNAVSQLCTQAQCESPEYFYWCQEMKDTPRMHRKQWEFCYILQALQNAGMLAEGRSGIGFGVGREPLTAVMASRGCTVLASDMDVTEAQNKGWVNTNQHASALEQLNNRGICDPQRFAQRVRYRTIDMNDLPDLKEEKFDFLWSSCALEHLGSLRKGLDFIRKSLAYLRPGGVAVHTTEYNLSSNFLTIPFGPTVLYRRRDILRFADGLRAEGHSIDLNLNPGNGELDKYIDWPPYQSAPHLRLRMVKIKGLMPLFTMTSIGLIIKKAS